MVGICRGLLVLVLDCRAGPIEIHDGYKGVSVSPASREGKGMSLSIPKPSSKMDQNATATEAAE
jgi:hypothetical protein